MSGRARRCSRRGLRRRRNLIVGRRRSGNERRRTTKPEVLLRADVNRAHVLLCQLVRSDNARRQQHDDVGLADLVVVRREQLPKNGHSNDARHTAKQPALVLS